jgi:hypothetical protein
MQLKQGLFSRLPDCGIDIKFIKENYEQMGALKTLKYHSKLFYLFCQFLLNETFTKQIKRLSKCSAFLCLP